MDDGYEYNKGAKLPGTGHKGCWRVRIAVGNRLITAGFYSDKYNAQLAYHGIKAFLDPSYDVPAADTNGSRAVAYARQYWDSDFIPDKVKIAYEATRS